MIKMRIEPVTPTVRNSRMFIRFFSQRSIPLICFHYYVTVEYICVVFNSCVFLDAVRTQGSC